MDWFSWLSRTNLDPSLTYEYGVTFARNELQLEDSTYFNHEFLQSMGISIAKHRLEILKLAKKENGGGTTSKLSGVIKKCLRKCVSKFVLREEAVKDMPPEPNWYQEKRRAAMKVEKPMYRSRTMALSGPLDGRMHEKVITNNKVLKLSGPLDGRMNERVVYPSRSPMISRPMDGRLMGTAKSPRLSGPLDSRVMPGSRSPRITRPSDAGPDSPRPYSPYYNKAKGDYDYDEEHPQWPTLFQDLKPT